MLKRILGFDTSAINALADDPDSAAITAGLVLGFETRLPASTVEEIAGNRDLNRREQLLNQCQRLLSSDGSACIWPFHYVTELLIREFEKKGGAFDWRAVPVRATEYEREIVCREIISDPLAAEHLAIVRATEQQFTELFAEARPEFERLFSSGIERPATFRALVEGLQGSGGAFWSYGAGFYERIGRLRSEEGLIRKFVEVCPPFRAVVLAAVMAQFERCIRDLKTGISYRAGRIDLFMSAYLPYCNVFVTSDERQERCLREIVSVGGLSTDVMSYDRLRRDFLVAE